MKILMTSETYLPRIGGAEIHVDNLFNKLKKSGHQVSLITNDIGPVTPDVVRIPWKKTSSLKLVASVWFLSKNVDLIHSHYCHRLALIAGLIGLIRRVPVVITLHGMGILDHPNAAYWARKSHAFYRYWSLQLATRVISTSEDLAIVADKYISRKKLTVILNGYDADLFKSGDTSEELFIETKGKKVIMTVRRLVPKNGIQYLVEALPFIVKEDPLVHFLILGDGPLKAGLEERVAELNLENNVTFLGMISNDLVVHYLRRAEVVVFPSTAESSSIACAEAMGLGKMVVASRVGGLVELLGSKEERGYLVDLVSWSGSNYDAPESLSIDRYQELADKILISLEDSPQNKTKMNNAMTYAKDNLNWDTVVEKTISQYLIITQK